MKYYQEVNSKIELTEEGKNALKILGISLEELKNYPDEKLCINYWSGCKTYMEQALKNRKGITWLDDGKIPYEKKDKEKALNKRDSFRNSKDGFQNEYIGGKPDNYKNELNQQGRFSANLLVSDDVLNDGKNISYGKSKEPYSYKGKKYKVEGFIGDNSPNAPSNYADSGSYSRYFSLDAWWKDKISKLPREVQRTFPFLICAKASKSEKNKGLEELPGRRFKGVKNRAHGTGEDYLSGGKWRRSPIVKNYHPTVKPIKLMAYLITLGSRPDDIVLDPFIGSGTTGCACVMLNRHYIGIEQSKEYYEIAKARIKAMIKTKERYW